MDEEYGLNKYPQGVRDAIHAKAWEDGHSGGYNDIMCQYSDLVAFVDKIIRSVAQAMG